MNYAESASSCMRLVESLVPAYRQLMKAGDLGDEQSNKRGRRKWATQESIDADMDAAIGDIRKGVKAVDIARRMGINERTFYARLRNRGLTIKKIRQP